MNEPLLDSDTCIPVSATNRNGLNISMNCCFVVPRHEDSMFYNYIVNAT